MAISFFPIVWSLSFSPSVKLHWWDGLLYWGSVWQLQFCVCGLVFWKLTSWSWVGSISAIAGTGAEKKGGRARPVLQWVSCWIGWAVLWNCSFTKLYSQCLHPIPVTVCGVCVFVSPALWLKLWCEFRVLLYLVIWCIHWKKCLVSNVGNTGEDGAVGRHKSASSVLCPLIYI